MKKQLKKTILTSLLTVAVMAYTVLPVAAAQPSTVTFLTETGMQKFTIQVNNAYYNLPDLFGGFKDVYPGDTLTQEIIVANNCSEYDAIKVYLQAKPHDETANPLSEKVLEEIQADARRDAQTSEKDYMEDFLAQLTLTVNKVENSAETELFSDTADQHVGLPEAILLGKIYEDDEIKLNVKLTVPADRNNDYAYRVGEIDWLFLVQGVNDPSDDPPSIIPDEPIPDEPIPEEPIPLEPYEPEEIPEEPIPTEPDEPEEIPEEEVPLAELPQTGLLQWPVPVMAAAGLLLILLGYTGDRKAKRARGG